MNAAGGRPAKKKNTKSTAAAEQSARFYLFYVFLRPLELQLTSGQLAAVGRLVKMNWLGDSEERWMNLNSSVPCEAVSELAALVVFF